jgi:cytidylate kinase
MATRTKRAAETYGISKETVENHIAKTDKSRASYYNYYAGKKWGAAETYNLTVDSGIGIDETVEVIAKYVEQRFKNK